MLDIFSQFNFDKPTVRISGEGCEEKCFGQHAHICQHLLSEWHLNVSTYTVLIRENKNKSKITDTTLETTGDELLIERYKAIIREIRSSSQVK